MIENRMVLYSKEDWEARLSKYDDEYFDEDAAMENYYEDRDAQSKE